MSATVRVCETFQSIQGETTWAGRSCFFIRLAGCNLSCSYCDTPQAREPGTEMPIDELVDRCRNSNATLVTITGGEPLLQSGLRALATALMDKTDKTLLIETNGTVDITAVPPGAIAIVDIKTPGSGESAHTDWKNIERLHPDDEVKFVLVDRADYEWARDVVATKGIADRCRSVHFSPASGQLPPASLAEWICEDALPVRLHLQLHKLAGVR